MPQSLSEETTVHGHRRLIKSETKMDDDDDGYSNTAYLENITAALCSHSGGLQQSTLSPTVEAWSSPSLDDVQVVNNQRRRRKDRRKRAFAKLVQCLEREEDNEIECRPPLSITSGGRLKSALRREYLPEHVRSGVGGNGCSGTSGNGGVLPRYHYHRFSSYSSKYCCTCCICVWRNCGNCQLLKIFVGVTLLLAVLLSLADRCGDPVDRKKIISSSQPPNDHPIIRTTEVFVRKNLTNLSLIIDQKLWSGKSTLASVITRNITRNTSDASSVSSNQYCPFRYFYLVLLSLGLLVYLSIFLTYTCKLVVHYHHFPWFLSEAIAVGIFSVMLLFASITGLLLKSQSASSTLGLIDALFGFVIAFSAYLSHFYGELPMMNMCVDDDPDCNQLNRILGEKQFSRIVRKH